MVSLFSFEVMTIVISGANKTRKVYKLTDNSSYFQYFPMDGSFPVGDKF